MKRPNGAGTVEQHRGRWRVRAVVEGRRRVLTTCDTREDAERFLAAWIFARTTAAIEAPTKATIAGLASGWLDARELDGSDTRAEVRDIDSERSLYRRHIEPDDLARMPLATITTLDVELFARRLRRRPKVHAIRAGETMILREVPGETISRSTQRHALRLLGALLEYARKRGVIDANPAEGVRVAPDAGRERDLSDDWLRAHEIDRLLRCERIASADRRAYACAIGLALRERDLASIAVADVVLEDAVIGPHVRVPAIAKTGRPHRVPILDWLLPIVREQLAEIDADSRWLFPARHGGRYAAGHDWRWAPKPERLWRGEGAERRRELVVRPGALELAGVERRIRFHDLRGTTATHLALGTWGRAWSLHEIQAMLAHSDQRVTERYVRRAIDPLAAAARATPGGPSLPPAAPTDSPKYLRTQSDSNARPTAPEAVTPLNDLARVDPLGGCAGAAELAVWVIETLAGDQHGLRRVIERCEAIVIAARAAEEVEHG